MEEWFGSNQGNDVDERGCVENYIAFRSGGLHPAVNGLSFVLITGRVDHFTN